jgi:hypothetical protein
VCIPLEGCTIDAGIDLYLVFKEISCFKKIKTSLKTFNLIYSFLKASFS